MSELRWVRRKDAKGFKLILQQEMLVSAFYPPATIGKRLEWVDVPIADAEQENKPSEPEQENTEK